MSLPPPIFLTHAVSPTSSSSPSQLNSILTTDLQSLAAEGLLRPCLAPALQLSLQRHQAQQGNSQMASRRMPLVLPSNKPLVLQVSDAVDVSKPLSERVKGVADANATSAPTTAASPPPATGKRGMGKLLLTDGFTFITAIELQPCPRLNQLSIGAKVVVAGVSDAGPANSTAPPTRLLLNASPTSSVPADGAFSLLLGPSSILEVKGNVSALEQLYFDRLAAMAHKLSGRPILPPETNNPTTNRNVGFGEITSSQEEVLLGNGGASGTNSRNFQDIDDANLFLTLGSSARAVAPSSSAPLSVGVAHRAAPQRTMLNFTNSAATSTAHTNPTASMATGLDHNDRQSAPPPELSPSPAAPTGYPIANTTAINVDDDNDNATTVLTPPQPQAPSKDERLPVAPQQPPQPNQTTFDVYGKIEELISELAVVPTNTNGSSLGYSLLASLVVAQHPTAANGSRPYPQPASLTVDLGTPFVTALLGGLPPSQYQTLLTDESRVEELIAVAEHVASRLIDLPPQHFRLEKINEVGKGETQFRVVSVNSVPF